MNPAAYPPITPDVSVDHRLDVSSTWRGEYHLATNTTTSDVEEVFPVRRRWCAPTVVLVERSGGTDRRHVARAERLCDAS